MQTDGQKEETESIKIQLQNLGTVNKNKVIISKGNKTVSLYFSYETLIAVDGVVSVNDWSMTTGKLLNELEPNHKNRKPHAEVLRIAQERIKEVLYGSLSSSFIVNSKDVFDVNKNPNLSLSPKDILKNPKIPKKELKEIGNIIKKKLDAGEFNCFGGSNG